MVVLTQTKQTVDQQLRFPTFVDNLIGEDDFFYRGEATPNEVGDSQMSAGYYSGIGRHLGLTKDMLDSREIAPEDTPSCPSLMALFAQSRSSADSPKTRQRLMPHNTIYSFQK